MFRQLKSLWANIDGSADRKRIDSLEKELRDLSLKFTKCIEVHSDISPSAHEASTIVFIGKYKHSDYVRVANVSGETFQRTVDLVRSMDRSGHRIGRVDAPREFAAYLWRDLDRDNRR